MLAYFAIPRLAAAKIENVALLVGVVTVLNAFLGIAQYSSPPDAALNYYATSDLVSATAFEENVRAAGTFSYITGFTNLATIGSWAGLSLLCLAKGRIRYIVFGWAFYLSALTCALVSISRGTVLTVLAMLVAVMLSGGRFFDNAIKGLAAIIVIVTASYVLDINPLAEKLADTVIARHESADDTIETRTIDPILDIGTAAMIAPTGVGFGTEQVAGVYAETGVMSMRRFESQFARIVMESGLIGLFGFLMTCGGTLYVIFKTRGSIADAGLRRVFVLSAVLVGSFFFTNVGFNHFASFFAWTVVTITLANVARSSEGHQISNRLIAAPWQPKKIEQQRAIAHRISPICS